MYARTILCVAFAAIASGCMAASTAPQGWRRSEKDVQQLALGSWTRVETRGKTVSPGEGLARAFDGELIAADARSVVLAKGPAVTVIPATCVTRMTIAAFEPGIAEAVVFGSLGTVSTLSHGFFLVVSAPVWFLTTMGATWAQSSAGTLENPKQVAAWARFPQGVPAGFLEQPGHVVTNESDCLPLKAQARPSTRWEQP